VVDLAECRFSTISSCYSQRLFNCSSFHFVSFYRHRLKHLAKFQQHTCAMTAALILRLFYDTRVYGFSIFFKLFSPSCCSSPSRVDFTGLFGSRTAMGAMVVSRGFRPVLALRSGDVKRVLKREKIIFRPWRVALVSSFVVTLGIICWSALVG
jgi:hypothetical protein